MKMETDDSPEPDHSPTQSSPELLPYGSRNNLILTPPSAFADSLLQSQQGTPKEQIYSSPNILLNCGGTYNIPSRFPQSVLQCHGHSPRVIPSVLGTIQENSGHAGSLTESMSNSCVVSRDSSVHATASALNMTSLVHRGSPSNLATASTMNSTFALRSPLAPCSVRRTPVIMVTDSTKGNSAFAARSSFSFQPPSFNNCRRTPSILVGDSDSCRRTPSILVSDSVLGNSTFGVQSLCSTEQRSSLAHMTPCIMATNSMMGNSTFGLQSLCGTGLSRSNSSQRTPSVLDTNSVMGNSTMETTSPVQPAVDTPQPATNNLANETPLTGTSMWRASPMNLSEHPSASACCATTPQKNACLTPSDYDREVERSEHMMDVTPSSLNELAECWARIDSCKNNDNELKEELGKIKAQFFVLLDTLGLSHDVYYNAVTPADTPDSVHLRSRLHQSLLTAAGTLAQHRRNSQNVNSVLSGNRPPTKPPRMSTPRSTPRRRPHGRQHGNDASSKYADLVLEQLLAKARSESNSSSSKSNSPPDPRAADHDAAAARHAPDQLHSHPEADHNGACLPDSVNVNRGSEDAVAKDSAKSKVIPVFSDDEACNGGDMTLPEHLESAVTEEQELLVPTVTPEVLLSTSSSAPTSSNGSSSNSSVPDLNKELVSRMQYYSDFTIDRQKKIDEAQRNLEPVPETSDETSSSMTPPTECSSDRISPRCVEGSESVDHFKLPLPPRIMVQSAVLRTKGDKSKNCPSSETDESDTSSGTGSMPSSEQTSHPSSHHSSHSSKHSSRNRQSSGSSSGDHRSSSRGSRCSTHPLASSTFISDPKSGSPGSGSVYTWSLDNSSDENLHQSFLRSEKRRHKRSRRQRPKSSHSGTVIDSRSIARPETVIGADSPPHDNTSDVGSTLHLSHEFSDIDSTPRRFGGNRFENSMQGSVVRSSSMPRTSTRIGGGFMLKGESDLYHKTSSSPELSHPCSDLNYALSRIGPSNLSSGLQQPSSTDRSSSPSFKDRPDLPGKSSTSDSTTSYHSQCLTCNPGLVASPTNISVRLMGNEDPCDDILTNSPKSYDSSGVQPPFNSYMSQADSSSDYTTVSNSSAEPSIVASAPRQPRAFAVRSPGVFKVPFSPASTSRTVKRRAGAGGHSTHNVGVKTVGTPHFPVGALKYKEPISRRKLFGTGQSQLAGAYHAPKIFDRKALVRKFKKFSNNFKKDKDSSKFHTLANL